MVPSRTVRALLAIVAMGLVGFAVLQFVRPKIENPPVTAEVQAPAEVRQVLRSSCYGCHSDETKLKWFDEIVPAYWLVAHDVKEARSKLNFSEIGKLPPAQQKAALFEAVNMIQMGAMPLPPYVKLHPGTEVTQARLDVLRGYLSAPPDAVAVAKSAAQAMTDATVAAAQYMAWAKASGPAANVHPEFNGVGFLPDYKNWKAISSTDRFDNHTMREILGNDVAIKAIAEGHINPWPDGVAFGKVAWQQQPGDKDMVKTGAFIQVELMIKDAKKYAKSDGWGWGRWRGTDLKPYGKDAGFEGECMGCHAPVAKNDYVYTMPIGGQQ